LRDGKIKEAEELSRYALTATPEFQRTYQTLGDLHIHYKNIPGEVQDYQRCLSLDDAIAATIFTAGGYLHMLTAGRYLPLENILFAAMLRRLFYM